MIPCWVGELLYLPGDYDRNTRFFLKTNQFEGEFLGDFWVVFDTHFR